jgi:hypothetical protein
MACQHGTAGMLVMCALPQECMPCSKACSPAHWRNPERTDHKYSSPLANTALRSLPMLHHQPDLPPYQHTGARPSPRRRVAAVHWHCMQAPASHASLHGGTSERHGHLMAAARHGLHQKH